MMNRPLLIICLLLRSGLACRRDHARDNDRILAEKFIILRQYRYCCDVAVARHTGTCRDELTDDNVLFETVERVDLTLNCSIGENTSGLLEGCSGEEGIGSERSLGDTEEDSLALCRLFALCFCLCVRILVVEHIHGGTGHEIGIARIVDTNLTHHLTCDNFDVLIVDGNTTALINLDNFADVTMYF